MTLSAPPRPVEDLQDLEALEALIEEARRRAARRRRRGAAAIVVAVAAAALFIALGAGGGSGRKTTASSRAPADAGATTARGIVVVVMRGYVRVARTRTSPSGPVRYRESGRFRIVWRIPASGLKRGRSFRSTAAVVTGATTVIDAGVPARSCHGALTAGANPVLLRIVSPGDTGTTDIGMIASPNPIATATSANCRIGARASHWRGRRTGWIDVSPPRRAPHTDWWEFNHIGLGFYPNLTPLPKGGNSEGWIEGHIPGGYLTWLAVAHLHKAARASQIARTDRP